MQKIMFDDKYGLTNAVLAGRKTMTRRVCFEVPSDVKVSSCLWTPDDCTLELFTNLRPDPIIDVKPRYSIGEKIAIAQRYIDIPMEQLMKQRTDGKADRWPFEELVKQSKGYRNKMFVVACLMPYQIEITNIRVEHLQDISEEDAKCECTMFYNFMDKAYEVYGMKGSFATPIKAFAALIDKISGKGTWESNPNVYVYEFKLIK